MGKKRRDDQSIQEELLDRSISLLEGPLNRGLERVLKSRVVLLPVGLGFKITTKVLAAVVGARDGRSVASRSAGGGR